MTMKGFYRKHEDGSLTRHESVHSPEFTLDEENKESRDGYVWFDSAEEAYAFFATQPDVLTPIEAQAQVAHDAAAVAFEAMTPGKQALWEPVRAAVSKALKASEFERAYTILVTVPPLYDGMEDDRAAFLALFQ